MLQSLLAGRFKLQFHREMREVAVYEPVVDKNGPALKPGTGRPLRKADRTRPHDRNYRCQFTNCTVDRLADALPADRHVLNKTGLTWRYDVTFFVTPEFKLRDSSEPRGYQRN